MDIKKIKVTWIVRVKIPKESSTFPFYRSTKSMVDKEFQSLGSISEQ